MVVEVEEAVQLMEEEGEEAVQQPELVVPPECPMGIYMELQCKFLHFIL